MQGRAGPLLGLLRRSGRGQDVVERVVGLLDALGGQDRVAGAIRPGHRGQRRFHLAPTALRCPVPPRRCRLAHRRPWRWRVRPGPEPIGSAAAPRPATGWRPACRWRRAGWSPGRRPPGRCGRPPRPAWCLLRVASCRAVVADDLAKSSRSAGLGSVVDHRAQCGRRVGRTQPGQGAQMVGDPGVLRGDRCLEFGQRNGQPVLQVEHLVEAFALRVQRGVGVGAAGDDLVHPAPAGGLVLGDVVVDLLPQLEGRGQRVAGASRRPPRKSAIAGLPKVASARFSCASLVRTALSVAIRICTLRSDTDCSGSSGSAGSVAGLALSAARRHRPNPHLPRAVRRLGLPGLAEPEVAADQQHQQHQPEDPGLAARGRRAADWWCAGRRRPPRQPRASRSPSAAARCRSARWCSAGSVLTAEPVGAVNP